MIVHAGEFSFAGKAYPHTGFILPRVGATEQIPGSTLPNRTAILLPITPAYVTLLLCETA